MRITKCLAALLTALAVSVSCLRADDGTKLFIHYTDGTQLELDFADKPTIKFGVRNLVKISSASMSLIAKPFKNVDKITFSGQSGIDDVISGEKGISAGQDNKVAFIGFKPGTGITVTSVGGIVFRSVSVDSEDRFEISLEGLPKGVYIITADGEVCKLVVE